jgi:hypothetical protein
MFDLSTIKRQQAGSQLPSVGVHDIAVGCHWVVTFQFGDGERAFEIARKWHDRTMQAPHPHDGMTGSDAFADEACRQTLTWTSWSLLVFVQRGKPS